MGADMNFKLKKLSDSQLSLAARKNIQTKTARERIPLYGLTAA